MTAPAPNAPASFAARVLVVPIRWYQRYISRYTPPSCRYYPCCSNYAITALRTRGAFVGTGLTIWRLLRCNPWSEGGVDHVPPRGSLRRRNGERDGLAASSSAGFEAADNGRDPVGSASGSLDAFDTTPGRTAA